LENQTDNIQVNQLQCDSADHVFKHTHKDGVHELTCVKCGKHLILPR